MQLQHKTLLAIKLLSEGQHSLKQMTEKLSVEKRHLYRVIRQIRTNGITVHSRFVKRVKYYWLDPTADFLPLILSKSERMEVMSLMTKGSPEQRTGLYKIIQLVNVRIQLIAQK